MRYIILYISEYLRTLVNSDYFSSRIVWFLITMPQQEFTVYACDEKYKLVSSLAEQNMLFEKTENNKHCRTDKPNKFFFMRCFLACFALLYLAKYRANILFVGYFLAYTQNSKTLL